MLKNAEEVKSAAAKVVEGRMTIWNARLELALALGDARKIDAVLARMPGEVSGLRLRLRLRLRRRQRQRRERGVVGSLIGSAARLSAKSLRGRPFRARMERGGYG